MLVTEDDAGGYGEERWIGIPPKGDRIYTILSTVRGEDTMRIISMRPATNTEIRRYEQQGQTQRKTHPKHRRRRGSHKSRDKDRS